jgi:hypothetical protein
MGLLGEFLLLEIDLAKFPLVFEGGMELGDRASLDSDLGPSGDGSVGDALLLVPDPSPASFLLWPPVEHPRRLPPL